jgi:hypothetical protein
MGGLFKIAHLEKKRVLVLCIPQSGPPHADPCAKKSNAARSQEILLIRIGEEQRKQNHIAECPDFDRHRGSFLAENQLE